MKTLITAIVLTLTASFSFSADLYGEAYRFDAVNHTGVIGIQGDHWGAEISAETGDFSVTNRQYLEFTNIEIGVAFELSNSHEDGAIDYRMIDIEGGNYLMPQPYVKVGSDWFVSVKLDESNTPVLSAGFKLF